MPALGSIFMKSFNHYTEPITQKSERSYRLKSAATNDGRRDARMGWKAGTRDVVLRPEWERRSHIVPLREAEFSSTSEFICWPMSKPIADPRVSARKGSLDGQ